MTRTLIFRGRYRAGLTPPPVFPEDCQIVTCSRLIPALVLVGTERRLAGEIAMRAQACIILCIGAILVAAPAWAAEGRYDPNYPVCMEAVGNGGSRIECVFTSYEQCRQASFGSSGSCFNNPSYVPRPAEAAPAQTDAEPPEPPEPPARPRKSAGRYDPDYPVCMEAVGNGGSGIECVFTSYEQCRQATFGSSGTCFNNPSYVPPPVEAAPAPTEPAPPAKAVKSAKSTKSVKSAKSLQLAPSPQPAQSH
jgi:hypothetical protein